MIAPASTPQSSPAPSTVADTSFTAALENQDSSPTAAEGATASAAPIASPPDFSTLTTEQLADRALAGARSIGRAQAGIANDATRQEGRALVAGVRAQLEADGASAEELAEFDKAVADTSALRAFQETGIRPANIDALLGRRDALQAGSLGAFTSTDAARTARLAGDTPSQPPAPEDAGAVDAPPEAPAPSTTIEDEVKAAVQEALTAPVPADGSRFSNVSSVGTLAASTRLGARKIGVGFTPFAGNSIDRELTTREGQQDVNAARAQLVLEGASDEQLALFDVSVGTIALQSYYRVLDDPRFDEALLEAARDAVTEVFAPFAEARLARLDPPLTIDTDLQQKVDDVVAGALANDGSAPLPGSNRAPAGTDIALAGNDQLSGLIEVAVNNLGIGVATDDADLIKAGQDIVGIVLREIAARGVPAEKIAASIATLGPAVAARAAVAERGLETSPSLAAVRRPLVSAVFDAIREADTSASPTMAEQRSFTGTNARPPVSIVTIDTQRNINHSEGIENLVETQLQEAGQSYDLTAIGEREFSTITEGSRLATVLLTVADLAPDFANISLGDAFADSFFQLELKQLAESDDEAVQALFDGIDLSLPINQSNLADYREVVRTVALDPERFESIVGDDFAIEMWSRFGTVLKAYEAIAAAGTNLFVAVPNSTQDFDPAQFASDEGLAGTITLVGSVSTVRSLESETFWLQGETIPDNERGPGGIAIGDENTTQRNGLIDVYAPSVIPFFDFDGETRGTSFASPEMMVNAILGIFDPQTETRVGAA